MRATSPVIREHVRHNAQSGSWELVRAAPSPALSPYIVEMQGYVESAVNPIRRRELPMAAIVLILNLDAPFQVACPELGQQSRAYPSFLAGLYDTYTIVESTGPAHCLQVDLTPIGAFRLLGIPMTDLARRTVELEDVIGPAARLLEEQIHSRSDWLERFQVFEEFAYSRLENAVEPAPQVLQAWSMIASPDQPVKITDVATEVGWSRKHLISRFKESVGLAPSVVARIVRFERAIDLMFAGRFRHWTDIAHECGYFDQSHFVREFRALAGSTPTGWEGSAPPDGSGVIEDLLTSAK